MGVFCFYIRLNGQTKKLSAVEAVKYLRDNEYPDEINLRLEDV